MNNEKAQAIQKAACTNLLIFCAINYSVKQPNAALAEITRDDIGKKRQIYKIEHESCTSNSFAHFH
jgi:hypothetical protein